MFKILFWLGLIGGSVIVGGQVVPIYYNELKIEKVFEGVAENLVNSDERDIENRIHKLLKIQSVNFNILPEEFEENLRIYKKDGKLFIDSKYHITLWLLGAPISVDPESDYAESDVEPMDKLRLRARLDFDFTPEAETP